jgi:hypothetical protein
LVDASIAYYRYFSKSKLLMSYRRKNTIIPQFGREEIHTNFESAENYLSVSKKSLILHMKVKRSGHSIPLNFHLILCSKFMDKEQIQSSKKVTI